MKRGSTSRASEADDMAEESDPTQIKPYANGVIGTTYKRKAVA